MANVSIYREISWTLGGLGPICLLGLGLGLDPFACWVWAWAHLLVGVELEPICLLDLSLDLDAFS